MARILPKLAAATASVALGAIALASNPAQAALFTFSYGDSGFLSFDDATSGLTGIGREQATLSQLGGNFSFY